MIAVCFPHAFCLCGKMVVDVDGMDARRTAVMTVTIGGGGGFEPIGIDHASGCPTEPCLHRVHFFTRVRSLTRLRRIYTLKQDLHRVYTVLTPCIPLHRTSFLHA